jgi:hypothetical protein
LAHSTPSAAFIAPLLGLFKVIGSFCCEQHLAHSTPSAAFIAPLLGLFKVIGSFFCEQH